MKLVEADPETGRVKKTKTYYSLLDELRQLDVDVVVLDPLAELTIGIDENSAAMHELHAALRKLARALNVPVVLVHHFSKMGTGTNQNSFRGSSTLGAGARIVLNVERMTKEDGEKYGVPESDQPSRIKAYVSKANYTATGACSWFALQEQQIANGEWAVSLEPWSPEDPEEDVTGEVVEKVLDAIEAGREDGERWSPKSKARRSNRADVMIAERFKLTEPRAKDLLRKMRDDGCVAVEPYYSKKAKEEVPGFVVKHRDFGRVQRELGI